MPGARCSASPFLAILSELLWASFPAFYAIIIGALLVFFVLAAPDGIWGRWHALMRRRRDGFRAEEA